MESRFNLYIGLWCGEHSFEQYCRVIRSGQSYKPLEHASALVFHCCCAVQHVRLRPRRSSTADRRSRYSGK